MVSNRLPALLLALCLAGAAHGSMMALDLGAEFIKVALIKPGKTPISIVVNEMSRRKSPGLVGVVAGERLLGEEALSLAVRHPESIFTRARDLLGVPASDPGLQDMLRAYSLPYTVVPHSEGRPTAAVRAKDGAVLSAEELVVGGPCCCCCCCCRGAMCTLAARAVLPCMVRGAKSRRVGAWKAQEGGAGRARLHLAPPHARSHAIALHSMVACVHACVRCLHASNARAHACVCEREQTSLHACPPRPPSTPWNACSLDMEVCTGQCPHAQ